MSDYYVNIRAQMTENAPATVISQRDKIIQIQEDLIWIEESWENPTPKWDDLKKVLPTASILVKWPKLFILQIPHLTSQNSKIWNLDQMLRNNSVTGIKLPQGDAMRPADKVLKQWRIANSLIRGGKKVRL